MNLNWYPESGKVRRRVWKRGERDLLASDKNDIFKYTKQVRFRCFGVVGGYRVV
jgi:hypothetical protein